MKPSQQIAEEMASEAVQKCIDDVTLVCKDGILSAIPLTQLIEVARAAQLSAKAVGHSQQVYTAELMIEALIALKQTGKAGWL